MGDEGSQKSNGVSMSVQTLVHIGLETLVISGVTIWLTKKIGRLEDHVEHLSNEFLKKVGEKDEIIAALIKRQEAMEHLLVTVLQNNPQLQPHNNYGQPSIPQSYMPYPSNGGMQQFTPFTQQPQYEGYRAPQYQQPFMMQKPPMPQPPHFHQHTSPLQQHQQHIPQHQPYYPPHTFQSPIPAMPQFQTPQPNSTPVANPAKEVKKESNAKPKEVAVTPVPEENFEELDDILKEQLGNILFEEEDGIDSKKKLE